MRLRTNKLPAILGIIVVITGLITYSSAIFFPDQIKGKLVGAALERAVVQQQIPDFQLINNKKSLILSTENISPDLVPDFPGLQISLQTPQEIQEKANRDGDFLRLRFREIKIGVFKSTVALDNSWVVSENSKQGYLSGGGFQLTFYNLFGFWLKSPQRTEWIS